MVPRAKESLPELQAVQCTVHCTLQCILYTIHYTVYTLYCTLYTVHSTTHYKLHTIQYTQHCTLHCIPLNIHCTLSTKNCPLYSAHGTKTAQSVSTHCTLNHHTPEASEEALADSRGLESLETGQCQLSVASSGAGQWWSWALVKPDCGGTGC